MPSIHIPTNTPLSTPVPPATSAAAPPSDVSISTGQGSLSELERPHATNLGLIENAREIIMENQVVINTFIADPRYHMTLAPHEAGLTCRGPGGSDESDGSFTVGAPEDHPAATGKAGSGEVYGGVFTSLKRMWQQEGFAGFMKGNGINVVRILPYSALQFTSYGAFKNFLSQWSGEEVLSTPLRLSAGAGAGIVAVCATYPLDLVRARLSLATANMAVRDGAKAAFSAADAKLGMVGMTKKVYATEGGLRGLYRGCWATAVGVAPYVSLNFYIYESLKTVILPAEVVQDPNISEVNLAVRKLGSGALSGAISLIFTHPFDVLRRKLQIAGLSTLSPQYTGAIDCMRKSIIEEGFWRGMYRGLVPNLIKVTPSIAVSFYTFETVKELLAKWENVEDDHVV